MSENLRARERHEVEDRCAFCHDAFVPSPLDSGALRAECMKCGAPHHAGCFVENAGCSVMGCGGAETTRVGELPGTMNVAELGRAIGASVDRPIPPRVKRAIAKRGMLTALVLAGFLALALIPMLEPRFVAGLAIVVGAGIGVTVWVGEVLHPARAVEPDERTGPPCPECGTPLMLEKDGETFCYRCQDQGQDPG